MQSGDRQAADSLFSAAAYRLRLMSRSLMAREKTGGFHASDLVQETYAQKMAGIHKVAVQGREHFFSLMAAGMRQVLTDRARLRGAIKRQPQAQTVRSSDRANGQLIDLKTALRKLDRLDRGCAAVVRLKHESGSTWEEIASETGLSVWQVRAEYAHALQWLHAEIA